MSRGNSRPTRSAASTSGVSRTRPYRAAMDGNRAAAETCQQAGHLPGPRKRAGLQHGNRAEAARTLAAVPPLMPQLGPRQRRLHGEHDAFPAGWDLLPKDRIHHCHCKNTARQRRRKNRVVARRHRPHRLGRTVPRAQGHRLPQRRFAGNSLARRRHSRSLQPHQFGRDEERLSMPQEPFSFACRHHQTTHSWDSPLRSCA